ncbi:transposase [Candidatus Finniella inopinata]|uniref:Transposase n=1 Tax=Candidatus Finniella inopinata TaxID=1696036 RepID=A0A4Q7DKQ9_9PROT|nr:transposase [Candidatus Finniella inopinata]
MILLRTAVIGCKRDSNLARPIKHTKRELLNAVFMLRTGCPWCHLPYLSKLESVYNQFRK